MLVLLLGALYVRMLMAGGDEAPLPDGTTPAAQGATIEGEDAKQAGLVAATEATEEVLSYQASTLDEDIAKAEKRLGPDMRREYADTMKAIRADTLKDDAKVQATVVASSIISAGDHDVKALLFVNQSTTGKHLTEPRVDLNRVVVSLHRDEGEWTVTKLDAL